MKKHPKKTNVPNGGDFSKVPRPTLLKGTNVCFVPGADRARSPGGDASLCAEDRVLGRVRRAMMWASSELHRLSARMFAPTSGPESKLRSTRGHKYTCTQAGAPVLFWSCLLQVATEQRKEAANNGRSAKHVLCFTVVCILALSLAMDL